MTSLALLLFLASLRTNNSIPDVIDSTAGTRLWTSATSVAETRCSTKWSEPIGDTEHGHGSRAKDPIVRLTEDAIAIYEGSVVAVATGFSGDNPGTLARVHVTRIIEASRSVDSDADLLVFHSFARFAAGGQAYCVGYRPIDPGDRIVVFVLHQPLDPSNRLVFASDGLFIEHDGHVLAPLAYLTSRSADYDVTLDQVRELAERALEK